MYCIIADDNHNKYLLGIDEYYSTWTKYPEPPQTSISTGPEHMHVF